MQDQLSRIEELKEQLLALGYCKSQLRTIIQDSIGKADLKSISPAQGEQLVTVLEDYIEFATACKAVTINK